MGSSFFKAFGSKAILDENVLSVTITGLSDNEEIVLHTSWRGQLTYPLGPVSLSYASFKDAEGNLFTTDAEGSTGVIIIIQRSDLQLYLTGSFKFTAVIPERDTIMVHNGYFFEVPFTYGDLSWD